MNRTHRSQWLVLGLALSVVLACGGLPAGTPAPAATPTAPGATATAALPSTEPAPTANNQALTQAEAQALVLDQVVGTVAPDDSIIVFAWPTPLTSADQLQAYAYHDLLPAPTVATIGAEAWFFWVDDYPQAFFAHPNRFVLVDRVSGALSVWEENWWPTLNGEGLWVEQKDYWNTANWAFSQQVQPPQPPANASASPSVAKLAGLVRQFETPGSAIVVNGWYPGESLRESFETDVANVKRMLTNSGFDVRQVGPLLPDDDMVNQLNQALETAIVQAATNLQAGETFVLYLDGHGFVQNGVGFLAGLPEWEIQGLLANFNPGVHVIVVLDGCFSGSFIDSLVEVADLVITSTDAEHFSYADIDTTNTGDDVNPDDEGSEFTSGFVEDWDSIEEDPELKWPLELLDESIDGPAGETNYWERLARKSLVSEIEKDAAYARGWTQPSFGWGNPNTKPVPAQPAGRLDAISKPILDRAGHLLFINLPVRFVVEVKRGSIIFDGPEPFVDVEGEWQPDGSFDASGTGTVAGFPDVSVTFTGTLASEGLTGYYTMGAGGELPQGAPIVYQIDGVWLARDDAQNETLDEFLAAFVPALQRNHATFLYDRLHPAVLERYGAEQCRTFMANRAPEPEVTIARAGPVTVGVWDWVLDERTTTVFDVATVPVTFSRAGQTNSTELHFARVEGRLRWFTDCGLPLN